MAKQSNITVNLDFYFDSSSVSIEPGETICVAGEFTNPEWQIWIPMTPPSQIFESSKDATLYHLRFPYQMEPSQKLLETPIQYKFVVKERSLWVLGKNLPTAASGDNNFINHTIVPWDFISQAQRAMITNEKKSMTPVIPQTSTSSSTPDSESAPLRRPILDSRKTYQNSSPSLSSDEEPYVNPLKTETQYIDRTRLERRRHKPCPACSII